MHNWIWQNCSFRELYIRILKYCEWRYKNKEGEKGRIKGWDKYLGLNCH